MKEQVRAAKKANREVNSNQTKMDDIYIYIYILNGTVCLRNDPCRLEKLEGKLLKI